MPLAGVIDPSHDERKALKAGRRPKWLPVEQAQSVAFGAEPTWSPWTYELLAAALGEMQDRGDHISTTALVSPCPRSVVIERKEPYIGDMDSLWRAFRGTMVHYVLEAAARPNSIAEHRFYTTVDDNQELSCSPDLVTSDTIWDYKNSAQVPRYDYVYPSHMLQLQFNRYIVNHMGRAEYRGEPVTEFPFDPRTTTYRHLCIVYMDQDGPKPLEVRKSIAVPGRTKNTRVADVWTDEKVREEMLPRYRAMRAALDAYPEWPDGIEEVWGGAPGWPCPGYPFCPLKGKCMAARYPEGLTWPNA